MESTFAIIAQKFTETFNKEAKTVDPESVTHVTDRLKLMSNFLENSECLL